MLRLQEALNALDPIDREILSLRHFEELTLAETALALGIEEAAAAKRYIRALKTTQGDSRRHAWRTRRVSDETAATHPADYVLLTRLADEFAARYRAGERPAVKEYIDRYPDLADDIRDLFPAMVEIEQVKEDPPGSRRASRRTGRPPFEQLGDFRILREVGHGGMGVVYEAEQVSLGRHVALKVLPERMLRDAKAEARFEREAKSAARLHHTNIVPVFGVGEHEGTPYYVMQFIQGLGLDEVLEELKKLQLGKAKTGSVAPATAASRTSGRLPCAGAESASQAPGPRPTARPRRGPIAAHRRFRGTANLPQEDAAARNRDAATRRQTEPHASSSVCSRPPALSDSFTLSSSSVVLPGRSRDGSRSRNGSRPTGRAWP